MNRLTEFRYQPSNTVVESYAYDPTGNRTSFTNASGTQAYTYPAISHRLAKVGTITRSYDAAGNTTAIGGTARKFTYNDAGRLSQAKQGGVAVMNYRYNGKGERVRAYLGTTNTYTLYDEAGHWLGDYDSNGSPIQQAIWLDDLPVGVIAGNQLHYIEPDHLGTPRVVIDPIRNVPVWSWDLKSEAFGDSPPNEDPDQDMTAFVLDLRFPGQRFDVASGLNYNYFRDYDSATGRYPQSDPIGLRGGLSTYGYVSSNPMLRIDPYGLEGIGPWSFPPDQAERQECSRARNCATIAMARIYLEMRWLNWKYSDKYFHCKANCEATRCGKCGEQRACEISDWREENDKERKGDSDGAIRADQLANDYGRRNAKSATGIPCTYVCKDYRPYGLPDPY